MSANISYLTTTVTLGHQTVHLQTDTLPTPSDASKVLDAINEQVAAGITFRMDPEQSISFTPTDLVAAIQGLGTAFAAFALPDLSTFAGDGADDLTVEIRNLVVSTKGSIGFDMRLALSDTFTSDIGIPDSLANLFGGASIGFGFSYSSPPAS